MGRTRWRSGCPRIRARQPLPLHKGASGGELSRIMLAIEVVFAGADPVPTFVFDEVDAGVGGKAAVEIGRRLARLARLAQVIVVTHLPQVAAFADTHLVVEKASDGSVVHSGITRLDRGGPGPGTVPDAGGPGGFRVRPGPCRRVAGCRRRGASRTGNPGSLARLAGQAHTAPQCRAGRASSLAGRLRCADLAKWLLNENAEPGVHRNAPREVKGPGRGRGDRSPGPADQEPDQAPEAWRHCHH